MPCGTAKPGEKTNHMKLLACEEQDDEATHDQSLPQTSRGREKARRRLQKKKGGEAATLESRKRRDSCSANARVTCGSDHVQERRRRTKIFLFFCFSSKVSSILLGKQDQETLSINQNQNRTKIFRACILTQGENRWDEPQNAIFGLSPFPSVKCSNSVP